MAFRDKARGPLGWILGVIGGLALLAGSFFAGMATADSPADQEQASVTEQQDQGTENNTEAEDRDAGPERGPRNDDNGGSDSETDADEKSDGDTQDGDTQDGDTQGRHGRHDGHHDGHRGGHGGGHGPDADDDGGPGADDDAPAGETPAQEDDSAEQDEPAA